MKTSPIPTHTLLAVQGSEGYKIQQAKEGKTNHLEPKYQSISKERKKKNKQNREPYHIKHREKRLGREKSREGLCESVGSLSSPDFIFSAPPQLLLVSFSAVVPDE